MSVDIKRAYEKPASTDGVRVLVDRLWPRGVSKQAASITAWLRELAPSNELRKWFHAHPALWSQFRSEYMKELRGAEAIADLNKLYALVADHKTVTLVYASRDERHNNAAVLRDLINGVRKPPSSSGPAKAAAAPKRARARR
jgi:uncharacterized protein YeaO (DUF488 family)